MERPIFLNDLDDPWSGQSREGISFEKNVSYPWVVVHSLLSTSPIPQRWIFDASLHVQDYPVWKPALSIENASILV